MALKQHRLDALADGIFAIVMTLLVIELKVPEIHEPITNASIWSALLESFPLLVSFILSFALVFTYWRAHHYISSVYAKNIDLKFTNLNGAFFFFLCIIPFSAYLLGRYHETQIAIVHYGLNIIFLGVILYLMRRHVIKSKTIENVELSPRQYREGTIRLLTPLILASIAIIVGFFSPNTALFLFTISVIFNLFGNSTHHIHKIIEKYYYKD